MNRREKAIRKLLRRFSLEEIDATIYHLQRTGGGANDPITAALIVDVFEALYDMDALFKRGMKP